MALSTPKQNIPYPEGPDTPDVPRDMAALALRLDILITQLDSTLIQTGRQVVTADSGRNNGTASITFTPAFSGTPRVVCTVESTSPADSATFIFPIVISPSATKVTVGGTHRNQAFTAKTTFNVAWIAIGPR